MKEQKNVLNNGNFLNLQIKKALSKSNLARDRSVGLNTLVARYLFDDMVNGKMEDQALVGEKYRDLESGILFDVLLKTKDLGEILKLREDGISIVPYFALGSLKNPQEYFISLNKKFPEMEKMIMGSKEKSPRLYKLVKTTFEQKMFAPGSYLIIDYD
jgi:hypothetical protein